MLSFTFFLNGKFPLLGESYKTSTKSKEVLSFNSGAFLLIKIHTSHIFCIGRGYYAPADSQYTVYPISLV